MTIDHSERYENSENETIEKKVSSELETFVYKGLES